MKYCVSPLRNLAKDLSHIFTGIIFIFRLLLLENTNGGKFCFGSFKENYRKSSPVFLSNK